MHAESLLRLERSGAVAERKTNMTTTVNKYLGRTATVKGMVVNGKPLTGKIVRLFGPGRDGQMRVSLYAESPTNLQQAFGGKMTNYTYRTADLEIHA